LHRRVRRERREWKKKTGSIRSPGGLSAQLLRFIDDWVPGCWNQRTKFAWLLNFGKMGVKVEEQRPLPVIYRDVKLDCGYRLDLVVEDSVVVEIKAVDQLAPIHDAQLLSYRVFRVSEWGCSLTFMFVCSKMG
jgi:GxxExxY protein